MDYLIFLPSTDDADGSFNLHSFQRFKDRKGGRPLSAQMMEIESSVRDIFQSRNPLSEDIEKMERKVMQTLQAHKPLSEDRNELEQKVTNAFQAQKQSSTSTDQLEEKVRLLLNAQKQSTDDMDALEDVLLEVIESRKKSSDDLYALEKSVLDLLQPRNASRDEVETLKTRVLALFQSRKQTDDEHAVATSNFSAKLRTVTNVTKYNNFTSGNETKVHMVLRALKKNALVSLYYVIVDRLRASDSLLLNDKTTLLKWWPHTHKVKGVSTPKTVSSVSEGYVRAKKKLCLRSHVTYG
jgi:hypothetical protein